MKSRIVIPLLILFLVIIVGGYFAASRVFHVNQKTRDYLNKRVSETLGGDFEASSVFILPWSISLKNARFRLKDVPAEIYVNRIKLNYSFIEFIKNRFKPIYSTEQIFLDRPEFIWISAKNDSSAGTFNFEKFPVISIRKIPQLRININKGSLGISKNDEKNIYADEISGWLDSNRPSKIFLNAEGKILSKKKNTTLKGTFNRERNTYSIDLVSRECNFAKMKLDVLSKKSAIIPREGSLDFTVHLEQKDDKLSVDGSFSVEHGTIELKKYGIDVSDMFITGSLNRKEIVFDKISASVLNVAPELSGRLSLEPVLSLKLNIQANDIELSSLLSEIYPEKETSLSGKFNLAATIEGPPGELKTGARLTSDALMYGNRQFRSFKANVGFDGEKLTFKNINAKYNNFYLYINGRSSFVPLAEKNDFSVSLIIQSLSNKKHDYLIQLDGSADSQKETYTADVKLKRLVAMQRSELAPDSTGYYSLAGNLSLVSDNLRFNIGNGVVDIEGTAENIFEHAEVVSTIRCSRFPIMNYLGYDNSNISIDGTGNLKGTYETAIFDGDFRLNAYDQVKTRIKSKAFARDIFKKSRRFNVDAQLSDMLVRYSHPLSLKLNAVSDSSGIILNVADDDGALLSANTELETGKLSGHLDLDEFPLERIIDIFKRGEFTHAGKLTGRAEIGGSIKDPFFTTLEPVNVTDLNIGGLNRLTGTGKVYGKFGELTFSDLHINRDNIHIMDAFGTWVTGKPFILDAQGEKVRFEAIGDLISKSRKCDGTADYNFSMVFTRNSGKINGDFVLRDGHFIDVPIDEAKGVLGGGSDGFNVTDFTVKKEGFFHGKGTASSGYLWKDVTEPPGLRMKLVFQGDLLKTLPYLTGAIKKASGQSQLNIVVGGTWQDPVVLDGELYVTNGTLKPAFLVDKVTNVTAILKIDPDYETTSGYKAVRIRVCNGVVNDRKLIVRNIHIGDKEWDSMKRPELMCVVNNKSRLDFGIFTGRLEGIKNRDRDSSIELHIPGFMESKETGRFELSKDAGRSFFIGASESDDSLTPYISGTILIRSGELTYPLLQDQESDGNADFLKDIYWDMEIYAGSSVYYFNEVTQKWRVFGTTVSRTFSKIEDNSVFRVHGRISDGSFRVTGDARSTSGSVSYLGTDFNIERIEFDLDSIRDEKPAILTGRARTVVYDSTGVPTEIFLNVSTVDSKSDQTRRAPGRVEPLFDNGARKTFDVKGLGTIQIEFTSTNPSDDTQEKILAKLGLSSESFGDTAARAFTRGFDSYYMNRWFRPFEDIVKKYTKLDVIQFTPTVLGNIMKSRLGFRERYSPESDYMLFDETRIMIGESFFREWFLSYRGQYGLSRDYLSRRERGFFHEIGLQYNLKGNTRLHFKYFYDDVLKEGERRIEVRHDFEF